MPNSTFLRIVSLLYIKLKFKLPIFFRKELIVISTWHEVQISFKAYIEMPDI
jgi:hypothetical protein